MAGRKYLEDLTGRRFGRWVVIGRDPLSPSGARWAVRCDCGGEATHYGSFLLARRTASCGCSSRTSATRRHGESRSRLYAIWRVMKSRCENPNATGYQYWGGKGVRVCVEWQTYERFRDWALGNGYADSLSIDREDGAGDYTPENCRWATPLTQTRNRAITHRAPDGRPWAQVVAENGVPYVTFRTRLASGWAIERAATQPVDALRADRVKLAKVQM